MTISDQTFEFIEKQLDLLGTKGPVALSCDDTKLLDALRMYWDEKEKKHYLVGAVEGKLEVADPEQMESVLKGRDYHKATKVRTHAVTAVALLKPLLRFASGASLYPHRRSPQS